MFRSRAQLAPTVRGSCWRGVSTKEPRQRRKDGLNLFNAQSRLFIVEFLGNGECFFARRIYDSRR